MKLDVRLEQIRSCVVFKDAIAKNFVANEHHSFTSVLTFSVVVVDVPTDRILTFLFPAETDVLVPVFSQSTDVVVVNFVVVLKFPNGVSNALENARSSLNSLRSDTTLANDVSRSFRSNPGTSSGSSTS